LGRKSGTVNDGKDIANHQWSSEGLVGLVAVYWAPELSVLYNAWTTRFRERNPHINPPPTPEWRARNINIMSWILRLCETFLALISALALLGLWKSG
jgi:hypothetical protein